MIASSIYLTGSTFEPDDGVMAEPDWRSLALNKLQRYGLKVVNPLQLTWPAPEQEERLDLRVQRALDLIEQCDGLLANLTKPSYGTAMEIFHAHRRGKLVTVVGPSPFSPWVLSHSQARFGDIDRALDYLIGEPPQFEPISWALKYEQYLSDRYEQLPPDGEPDYQFLGGDLPVMVIAPHATAYFRDGEFQEADSFTGSMAALLHRQAHCHALKSYYCLVADPCWHLETPMRRAFADIVRSGQIGAVLFLLGASWHESPGLQVEGIGPEPSDTLAQRLRLKLSGLEPVGSDSSDQVAGPLTRFIADELALPAIVLRMHKRYRMPKLQSQPFLQIVELIKEFVQETGLEFLRRAS